MSRAWEDQKWAQACSHPHSLPLRKGGLISPPSTPFPAGSGGSVLLTEIRVSRHFLVLPGHSLTWPGPTPETHSCFGHPSSLCPGPWQGRAPWPCTMRPISRRLSRMRCSSHWGGAVLYSAPPPAAAATPPPSEGSGQGSHPSHRTGSLHLRSRTSTSKFKTLQPPAPQVQHKDTRHCPSSSSVFYTDNTP